MSTGAVISASHQKGGVGKSTIIWNLLIEFSKDRKICVIDMDVQKSITSCLSIRKMKIGEGGTLKNIEELEAPKNEKELVDLLYQKCEMEGKLVFVDLGGFDSTLNRMVMASSNILLTPVSTKFFELLGARAYEKILKEISHTWRDGEKLVSSIVLNKINPNAKTKSEAINQSNEKIKTKLESTMEYIEKSEYFSLFKSIIHQKVEYEESPEVGQSVVEYKPYSSGAREILELKKEIENTISI